MALHEDGDLRPFYAMEINAHARRLEGLGRTICHLETGEPAAPPAPKVREAVAAALPEPQAYTQSKGMLGLREALAGYYRRWHGVAVDPESVVVTMGSSSGFILAFLAGFAPGARIAVTRPGYPAYLNILAALGFRAVEIPVAAADGWRLSADAVAAAHARTPFEGLLFASPANPTGAMAEPGEWQRIVSTCGRLGVRLISDEVYHWLDYDIPSTSALEFSAEPIVVNSFSKYYCMTGWRVGWMVVPEILRRRVEILQQNLFIAAPTLSQVAATVALGERDYADALKADYAQNRALLAAGLESLGFGVGRPSDGAFYIYADVSRFTNDAMGFCRRLLEEAGVAATPGVDFDRVEGHHFVRFSYAGTRRTVEEALERIGGWVR